jgi:hypothetical protein
VINVRFGLREKILIITVMTLLLAISVNAYIVSRLFRTEYSSALQSKIAVIANTVRTQIERLLVLGIAIDNIEGFDAQCQEILRKHPDLAYTMVVQSNGKILFHNDIRYHDTMINTPALLEAVKRNRQMACLSEVEGQECYNSVVPVGSGSAGHNAAVIVGFPASLIDGKVQELHNYSFIMALISFVQSGYNNSSDSR